MCILPAPVELRMRSVEYVEGAITGKPQVKVTLPKRVENTVAAYAGMPISSVQKSILANCVTEQRMRREAIVGAPNAVRCCATLGGGFRAAYDNCGCGCARIWRNDLQ